MLLKRQLRFFLLMASRERVNARLCQRWFARFRTGNFSLEDQERPGRPQVRETGDLETLLEEDSRQSTRE